MTDEVLTLKEASTFLTIHIQSLYRLIKAGKIKAVYVTPGRKTILQSELNRYLNEINGDDHEAV